MADDVLLDEACDRVAELEKELAARDARIEDLRNLLHRDRTGLAASLEACMNRARAGHWITEGRGSYEWNEDEYRKETGHLITQIIGIAQNGLGLSGKLADAAFHPDRDRAIMEAARSQLATAEAERDDARAWVRKMHAETQILTCVYCGHTYPPGTPASGSAALTAHVAVCPKHPLATLRAELVRIEGKLRATLNWHHGNLSGFGWGADLAKCLYPILDSITTLTCAPAAPPRRSPWLITAPAAAPASAFAASTPNVAAVLEMNRLTCEHEQVPNVVPRVQAEAWQAAGGMTRIAPYNLWYCPRCKDLVPVYRPKEEAA